MRSAFRAVRPRPYILAWSALLVLVQCKEAPTSSAAREPAPEAAVVPANPPPVASASASPASSGPLLETQLVRAVPPLREAMAALSRKIVELGGDLGAALLDIRSGDLLAVHSDRLPLNPASNAKLFTAAAALSLLHGNYRFETGLYGEQKGSSVSRLVLRGHGDPSFATSDLWEMVQDLRAAGVQRIEGDILVDQRFFDDSYVPPAFEQQPNEWASFRAPVSAVAINQNTVTMSVRPGAADGPALLSFDPPGMVDVQGTVGTAAAGVTENVKLDLAPNGYRLLARVGGALAQDERPVSFTRRVDNPTLLAGYALKALLSAAGIASTGDVKPGGEQQKRLLVLHHSRPLASLLDELGKASDNFYAEMVFKAIGAEKGGRPGKSAAGADVVVKYMKEIGAFDDGTVIRNGSGLFDANRVTAGETARLLRAAYLDPRIAPEFIAQLAVGGVDGTLHRRFRELRDKRVLRAKTGTLEGTVALSGYVLAPAGKDPIAFSILVNSVPGKVSGARAAIDPCVDEIVRYVWRDDGTHKQTRD